MRLFLKLFISFWATLLLSALAVAWLSQQMHARMEVNLHEHMQELARERLELATLLVRHGATALGEHMATHPHRELHFVLDENNRDLLHRALPPHLHAMLDETRRWHEEIPMTTPGWEKTPPFVPLPVTQAGTRFFLVIAPPPPTLGRLLGEQPLLPLAVVLISGMVVFALAGHFTRPLRRLRQTALRLGSGDLTARATSRPPLLPDEINGLTEDFNLMAQRLDHLFHAQHRLLRNVSHELRSPLARMRVAIGLMEREGESAPLKRLTLELERMDDLIGQIIRVSRPDTPEALRWENWVELGELARTVVADALYETGGEKDGVALRLTGELVVRADPILLRSTLENVVRNALHHSPAPETVTVTLARVGDQGQLVVADRGPGVPDIHLTRIFEPFHRVSESRERESGGFGLGLAIASRAIREHGGDIVARNREGGGLEVTITLPLEPEIADQGLPAAGG